MTAQIVVSLPSDACPRCEKRAWVHAHSEQHKGGQSSMFKCSTEGCDGTLNAYTPDDPRPPVAQTSRIN